MNTDTSSIIKIIIADLKTGSLMKLRQYQEYLNQYIIYLLQKPVLSTSEIEDLGGLIDIGNLTYNNMDSNPPIEDGIYDLMIECYRKYNNNCYPVGGEPIQFTPELKGAETPPKEVFTKISQEDIRYQNDMWFPEIIRYNGINHRGLQGQNLHTDYIKKRIHTTSHNHPDLVGTFDKCKFVLTSQAEMKGVANDSNVRILERDFLAPLITSGVISPYEQLTVIATLKYDGISVEADCSSVVHSARTRGDTGVGKASDISPILAGYQFHNDLTQVNGIKFEAIISGYNLQKLNQRKGYNYANCRMAIIGIINSSDAGNYRDLITLVPIATDIKDGNGNPLDRLVELDFLNNYYATGEIMRYSVFHGNYSEILYQMKRFVEEAEFARSRLPFMYDGVVFEFYDPKIRRLLGRDHYIDRYKVAVKFNPVKKQTVFRGYKYTVGQDGSITPMCYFDPVEFMGTIHTKASAHSYKRFKDLALRIGDILDIDYVNDVMPYVTKAKNDHNHQNAICHPPVSFPTHCPECGAEIVISSSGDSAYCVNMDCPGIAMKRMTNMLAKLGIINFGEKTIKMLGYRHFWQLMEAAKNVENFKALGPNDKYEFKNQLDKLLRVPTKDFKILGALGFTSIAEKTWKLILGKVALPDLYNYYIDGGYNQGNIRAMLIDIQGIGPETIETILREMQYFLPDIKYIMDHIPLIYTNRRILERVPKVRFTGCRDHDLEEYLESIGCDADGKAGITKDTTVLLVPYPEYTQGNKYKKAVKYQIPIISIDRFKENPSQYL